MSYTKAKTNMMKQTPLTDEEKREQIARFFTQKRESFAQGILFNLCHGLNFVPDDNDSKDLVDRAVNMADELIKKLYDVKE